MAPWRAGGHLWRWVAAALLVLLLLSLTLGEVTGWSVLRGPLQTQASRAVQVPVQLGGRFHLRLLGPPRLEVGELTVGAAQGVHAPHLLHAEEALLAWHWGDLWRWRRGEPLRLQALIAKILDLRLLRLADGRASWAVGAAKSSPTPDAAPDTGPELPRFGQLHVDAGHAVVNDALLDTALQIDLAGGERDVASGATGYQADIRGRWRALPLQLAVRMGGGALPMLHDAASNAEGVDGAAAPALPLRVEGSAGAAAVRAR